MAIRIILLLSLCWPFQQLTAQQLPDTLFQPQLVAKAYPNDDGPSVFIDQGHANFHTKDHRFAPFAKLVASDGYQVQGYENDFTAEGLAPVKILVISNALAADASAPFVVPTESAFSKTEIGVLKKWVKNGGSLFLIADHMPFAGAAAELAKAFGFHFYDGFLMDKQSGGILDFSRSNKLLSDHFISNGRSAEEKVTSVRSYTGQAFKIPKKAVSILNLDEEQYLLMPDTMWVFDDETPKIPADKFSQGAILSYGKGKVAMFGEAAMFTAQLAGPNQIKVGMNAAAANRNYQLLLNIIHWLDGQHFPQEY